MSVIVATAGWSIPGKEKDAFPEHGTALERYSQVLGGVEINSSFYRSHRPSTWARWAANVPEHFRFAVKVPRTITHEAKLVDCDALIARLAAEIEPLGTKLSVLLVQLPPKLAFDAITAERFFSTLNQRIDAGIVCEPHNATWLCDEADKLLADMGVARAAVDPAITASASTPGGSPSLAYWLLHGSPAIYRSDYDNGALDLYALKLSAAAQGKRDSWCVFDNTAASAATGNALSLLAKLRTRTGT